MLIISFFKVNSKDFKLSLNFQWAYLIYLHKINNFAVNWDIDLVLQYLFIESTVGHIYLLTK